MRFERAAYVCFKNSYTQNKNYSRRGYRVMVVSQAFS